MRQLKTNETAERPGGDGERGRVSEEGSTVEAALVQVY